MLTSGLGERLKETRELGELSARELGVLSRVSPTYPALIESGERKQVGADVVAKFAEVLGVTTDYLILGTGKKPSKRQVMTAVGAARSVRGAA